jgi:CRP-like cAMP-binding protein
MPVPGSSLCKSPAGTATCASSHRKVIQVTARPYGIWHNCSIMSVGTKSQILDASDALKASLSELGTKRYFSPDSTLFREDGNCVGVFLVVTGKVRLSVRSLPRLDRVFSGGSLLGLPSTFTGHPYSLTATVVADAEIVHVTQEEFVGLMRERPELCREATEMLGREVTFIQSALAQRRKEASTSRFPLTMA